MKTLIPVVILCAVQGLGAYADNGPAPARIAVCPPTASATKTSKNAVWCPRMEGAVNTSQGAVYTCPMQRAEPEK